jgi:hypothetical protein
VIFTERGQAALTLPMRYSGMSIQEPGGPRLQGSVPCLSRCLKKCAQPLQLFQRR